MTEYDQAHTISITDTILKLIALKSHNNNNNNNNNDNHNNSIKWSNNTVLVEDIKNMYIIGQQNLRYQI